MHIRNKLQAYSLTALFSVIIAVVGFSYNAWRLENTENNNNIRTAAFETFKALAELEQIIYTLHYDHNTVEGSPRKAWVQVGLIHDLSGIISTDVQDAAGILQQLWQQHWANVVTETASVEVIIKQIDVTRAAIKTTLLSLK